MDHTCWQTRRGLICLLVLLVASLSSASIVIRTVNNTEVTLSAVEIHFAPNSNSVALDTSIVSEVTMDINNATGKIFALRSTLAADVAILQAQQKGAIGFIYLSPTYYVGGYLKWRWSNKQQIASINIPVLETGVQDTKAFMSLHDSAQIQSIEIVPSDDPNPWDRVFYNPGYYIITVVLGLFAGTNASLAIWKLCLFVKFYGGCQTSIAIFVLTMELVSNILRLVLMVDPLSAHSIYPEPVSVAFLRLSFPFSISSLILIILYWHELMANYSVIVHPFVMKMRVPFFVISGLLLVLQGLQIGLRFINIEYFNLVLAIACVVVATAIVIFHTITGVKLLKRIVDSKRRMKLRRSTTKILLSAGFLIAFIVCAILFAIGFGFYPFNFVAVWYTLFAAMNGASMTNILAFELPRGSSSKGSSSTSKTVTEKNSQKSVTVVTVNSDTSVVGPVPDV